ncbi:hypothetical protein QBC35DRAFT_503587 [Podospora australis]|uniref:Uncharacterized protein n=1 Tax=Podospora australis TaxID=1536484 RepID=A0AAN6WPU0_9PEZI|nr:hypothetical protein QBC35DRAFT_503587 [Podospora australis]
MVAPFKQTESSEVSTKLGIDVAHVPVTGEVAYNSSVTRDMTYAATVIGATEVRGRNYGDSNCASWTLLENPATKTGVPVAMRAAIVLERKNEEKFQCEVTIKARADW